MTAKHFLRRLGRDEAGVTIVEFAMLSPLLIVMLFGVLQLGLMLQNYNALRHVSADVARYAMIQFATSNNTMSNDQLSTYASAVASKAPYVLTSTLVVTVQDDNAPDVTGVTQKTLTLSYRVPTVLDGMGLKGFFITYTQPLFLTTST